MSTLYPIFLTLRNQRVLIVGGGAVALRKAGSLLNASAKITLVSPDIHPDFKTLRHITKIQTTYDSSFMVLRPWRLVFAATHVSSINARVQKDAQKAGILCCRCDLPQKGDFSNASTGDLGPFTFAVSTAGTAPAIAIRMRDHLLATADLTLLALADLHTSWRQQIQSSLPSIAARQSLLRRLAAEEMESCLRHEGRSAAQRLFKRWLVAAQKSPRQPQRVSAHAK